MVHDFACFAAQDLAGRLSCELNAVTLQWALLSHVALTRRVR